jgi:tetratricopeptide (TPR) repeat protein
MASPCDKVQPFVDGELPPDEAEAFRLHLADCEKCQREVTSLMQLGFMVESHALEQARQEKAQVIRLPTAWRRRLPAFGAVAALAAALAVLMVRLPLTPTLQHDVWLAKRPERLLEARVSYQGADGYRPPASRMMGSEDASEDLPHEDLATLTRQGDAHGVIAAYLVRDDPKLAEWALKKLEGIERSPDLESDRAVALLLKGEREEALRVLEAVLEQNPRHPQALWNRGLVLRELGLSLLAAQSFSEVAALKEPGWSEEAARKAEALRRETLDRRDRWDAVIKAGEALVEAPPAALPADFDQIPSGRRLFYTAVRAAPTRERVLALLPVAQTLDARAGNSVLEGYVRRVAESDFSRRAPLTQTYVALSKKRLSPEEQERFLSALLQSKEDDLFLDAAVQAGAIARYLELYEAKAAASGDPWFQLLAAQERARAQAAGDWRRAVQTLLDATRLCTGGGLDYRCIFLEHKLAALYTTNHQLEPARVHAERGWQKARRLGEWRLESSLLWSLGQIARTRGDMFLARAYVKEFLARDRGEDPALTRQAHQELAVSAMQELRVDEARREIDAALATGNPLGVPGIFALADIARLKSAPGDETSLTRAVEAITPKLGPGERLIAAHALGRFFIERDVERGRGLLWRTIEQAEAPGLARDEGARRARAYGFTSLLMAAGRRGDFQEALKLVERERQVELPRTCLLVATADSERTLLMVLGADGVLKGHHDESRRKPLPQRLEGVVPEALLTSLRPCGHIAVIARPPLHGRAGLLPPELAWSYLTSTSAPQESRTGPAIHLVVSDVELPPDTTLRRLNAWTPRFGPDERPVRLTGAEATPSRVLSAMKNATEIDLVAHGVLNDSADASYLLLAPEPGGPELDDAEVRAAAFQGAPFVVLAACHAAHATYSVAAPLSLPAAFIEAGARGVLAATVQIPDLEAEAFFNAVRERMRSGTAPSLALREERMRWLREGKGEQWLDSVLLFE